MYRTHTCGELRVSHKGINTTLAGWVQKIRDKGGMIWIDLRDRYGITQLILEEGKSDNKLIEQARELGREDVIKIAGIVQERYSKNQNLATGEIEVLLSQLEMLNESNLPPFIIEDETDGGEDLRMKYRYLDLRRGPMKENLRLRHRLMNYTRDYLTRNQFIEVETPVLIKSTPEGARDFIVPSRINQGEFYALPQSPQTFKQLLMVGGLDKYFQIVKCFRDEDLRADRQPEFTQIDCEMSFVHRDDVLSMFEGLIKFLFKEEKGVDLADFGRMTYADAIANYGSDKPDLRFDMSFIELNSLVKGKGFKVFDDAELVVGILAKGCAEYSRKQLDELTDFVKKPQVGAKGLVYVKFQQDSTIKSSVDKFYNELDLQNWKKNCSAGNGDLLLIISGDAKTARTALSTLRLEMGNRLNLRDSNTYKPLWVLDFPLLEWEEESGRYFAMHHPFTSPKPEDLAKLESDPGSVNANAYDLVINGVEIGGGSIRIHDRSVQQRMFNILGFSKEEAQRQFGFLLEAFTYGAPPHGGIAFGFDRLCALFGGTESIRDYIAFPKNNAGRDVMIDTPSQIHKSQLDELGITVLSKKKKE
ncbi:MAG TPA: aspartate--tRNA ligase [Cyclobacteriaceae bacterium]